VQIETHIIIAFVVCFAIGAFLCISNSTSSDDEDTILVLKFMQKWDGYVKVSPDGENVAYVLNQYGGDRKVLCIINLKNGQRFDLADNPFSSYQPQWSSDGKYVAFILYSSSIPYGAKEENIGYYLLDIASKKMTRIHNISSDTVWSPDGSKVLSENDGTIIDVATNMKTQILDSINKARWSPAGSSIAFVPGFFPHPTIAVIECDGRKLKNVTTTLEDITNLQWLPDGSKIAFESANQIFVVDADGQSVPRQLTKGKGKSTNFQISPDGNFMAFESDQDGDWNVYLTQIDDANEKCLTQNHGYDGHPVWLDNNSIGFVSDMEGKPAFCMADKEGSVRILYPKSARNCPWITEILDVAYEEMAHEMVQEYYNKGNYEDVLRMSSFINKERYTYADIDFLKGASYFKLGDYNQAIMYLETASAQRENIYSIYRMNAMEYLADCYRIKGDYDRAIGLYEEIAMQYPLGSGHTEVPIKLPKTREEKLEYIMLHQDKIIADLQSKIIEDYKYVAGKYSNSQMAIEAFYHLGQFYQNNLRQPEKAKESYLKALELCGNSNELKDWLEKIQRALAEIEDGK